MTRLRFTLLIVNFILISTTSAVNASNLALLDGPDLVEQNKKYQSWTIPTGAVVVDNVTGRGIPSISFAPSAATPDYNAVLPFCSEHPEGPCVKSVRAKKADSSWLESQISQIQTPRCDYCSLISPSGIVRKQSFLPYDAINKIPAMDTSKYLYFSEEDRAKDRFFVLGVMLSKIPQVSNTITLMAGLEAVQLGDIKNYSINGVMSSSREVIALRIPTDISFEVSVDLKELFPSVTRWIYSDANEADIAINDSQITLVGKPSVRSVVSSDPVQCDALTENDWYSSFGGRIGKDQGRTKEQNIQRCVAASSAYGIPLEGRYVGAVADFEYWSSRLVPRYDYTSWKFTSLDPTSINLDRYVQDCIGKNDFVFSSTNAAARESELPTWNNYEKSFITKIASNSLLSSGEANKGFYTLTLTTSVAKCLWGEQVNPSQLSLSIVDSAGKPVVSTIEQGSKNNFFNLRISGFPYSQKFISFGLPKPAPKKSLTITCVKGKLTKKVTAANPKCPSGYKKK
jgi:hypothetical protein